MDYMLEDPNGNEIQHDDWYCAHRDCEGLVGSTNLPEENEPCECLCHLTEQELQDLATQQRLDEERGK